jgi:hypothetical protein
VARRKKPENETTEDAAIRHIMETVSSTATRNEKVSWNRKMDGMQELLTKIRPIEDSITDLLAIKQPLIDQIQDVRQEMVKDCVHPYTHLIYKDDHVVCKFCYKKFVVQVYE